MADKDVNIHVNIEDADAAKRQIDDVNESLEGMGDTAEQSGDKGAEATKKQSSGMDELEQRLYKSLTVWNLVTKAINLGTQAIKGNIQAMEEHAEVANRQQKSFLRLQTLGDFYTENPEARQQAREMSEYMGRPVEETYDAWYNLYSKTAGMDKSIRMDIMKESAEFLRMDPEAPADTVVDMFSLYQKQSGQRDINAIQNVMAQTIAEAGGGLEDVANYMPRFLPIGIAGQLSPAESAGLWAWGTTRESEASVATTGLRNILMSLQGKGTPESAKILSGYGIDPSMDFQQKVSLLGKAHEAGDLDLAASEIIAGREGMNMLIQLAADPDAAFAAMQNVTEAEAYVGDITAEKLNTIMTKDPYAAAEEATRRTEVAIENRKGQDENAIYGELMLRQMELDSRDLGQPGIARITQKLTKQIQMGIGIPAEQVFEDYLEDRERYERSGQLGPTIINNNNVVYMDKEQPATERYPQ